MSFVPFSDIQKFLAGKRVAIVGSGPGSLDNEPGFIDGHDVVIRVNNYKNGYRQGCKTDIHYSFYGTSIKKSGKDLIDDGVKFCMCKCPNSKPIESRWHEVNNKIIGVDFRYIYRNRQHWWPVDVFVPDDPHFLRVFNLLEGHIPTTGFSCIQDVISCAPSSVYLTGFDFFTSLVHNVNEQWKPNNQNDPIGHRPELERDWVNKNRGMFQFDKKLKEML